MTFSPPSEVRPARIPYLRRSVLLSGLAVAVAVPSVVLPTAPTTRAAAAPSPAPGGEPPDLPLPDPARLLQQIEALSEEEPRTTADRPAQPAPKADDEASRAREKREVAKHRKPAKRLPLGKDALKEKRTVRKLADGVTLTVIRRGGRPVKKENISSSPRGPWVIRALTIDPQVANGKLATTFGPDLARTKRTTDLTQSANALAGVNASFFSLGSSHPGDPAGLTIAGGQVLSEPTGMSREMTLLVDSKRNALRMGSFRWTGRVRNLATDETRPIDVVNSAPHIPRECDTRKSQRDCARPGQIAAFTPDFARKTPRGVGFEVVLDLNGCVTETRTKRGVRLGRGQTSLQATGGAVRELKSLVGKGCLITSSKVKDSDGDAVELRRSTSAVTGRFRLVNDGKIVAPSSSKPFFRRHPRTIAGTTWDGKIVLITIDGRQNRSVGATLREAAKVARALGLRDAMNLDGGGSTTMSVRGKLVNDLPGAERAVSDALVWLRRR